MKKLLSVSLIMFISAIVISCKKDPTDIPIGTIKVDIGGNPSTFSVQARATRLLVTGGYGIQIQGYYKTSSTTNLSSAL